MPRQKMSKRRSPSSDRRTWFIGTLALLVAMSLLGSSGGVARAQAKPPGTGPESILQGEWTNGDDLWKVQVSGSQGVLTKADETWCSPNGWKSSGGAPPIWTNITGSDLSYTADRLVCPRDSKRVKVTLTLSFSGGTAYLYEEGNPNIWSRPVVTCPLEAEAEPSSSPVVSARSSSATASSTSYPMVVPVGNGYNDLGVHGPGFRRYTVHVVDVLPDPGECPAPVSEAWISMNAISTGKLVGQGWGRASGGAKVWDKVRISVALDRPTYGAWAIVTPEP